MAGASPIRIAQTVWIHALELQAPPAVIHRFSQRLIGYVFAVSGDGHLATETDAAQLAAGGGANVIGEPGFSLRGRSRAATVLLVETMNAVR